MAMKTNVHGLLAVAQHVGPKMEKRGEGVIVVTGATASLRGRLTSWTNFFESIANFCTNCEFRNDKTFSEE